MPKSINNRSTEKDPAWIDKGMDGVFVPQRGDFKREPGGEVFLSGTEAGAVGALHLPCREV